MRPIKISDSEWQVMTLIWEKAPLPASEVVAALGKQKKWHPRTIRTLLDRLVKKQALLAILEGNRYLYQPLVSMEASVRQESRSFLQRVFGGESTAMLLHLVDDAELSKEDIKRLRAILAEKEK